MLPYQKNNIKSVDSLKRICILEKKKRLLSSLRERLAFLNPDISYRKLQRVCLTSLTFHRFHLLRQIDAGPLYSLREIPVLIHSIWIGLKLDQYSNS